MFSCNWLSVTDGHSCVGFISHACPWFQLCCLDIRAFASIPLVMRSAGLEAVGQYLHVLCEVMSLISCTRCHLKVPGSIPGLGTSFGEIDQTELCTFYGVYSIPPRLTVYD